MEDSVVLHFCVRCSWISNLYFLLKATLSSSSHWKDMWGFFSPILSALVQDSGEVKNILLNIWIWNLWRTNTTLSFPAGWSLENKLLSLGSFFKPRPWHFCQDSCSLETLSWLANLQFFLEHNRSGIFLNFL